ncbi:MAG: hypothetical protein Q8P83_03825, partial [bacterium]|nr:hypothetical protein [bacterium]
SGNGQSSSFTPIANNTVVYGYWTDKNSKIGAVDLSSGKIYSLASLDLKIKKATIMAPASLIFINKTDDKDHGREVASYNFVTKATTSLFQADQDFGIDDYVISPGKRYITDWEIQNPVNADGLIGGRSRVYTIDLQNPSQKNLIYDEAIQDGVAMHYPIGVTDSGEVFLDGFIANVQAGWANGMSYSNLSGTQKQNISSMTAGTYSTQPTVSQDGKYLAFAGYDGAQGTGISAEGFRQEILNPDTIEILDTVAKQRKKLAGLSNANRYPSVLWDKSSSNIIFSIVSKDVNQNGFYLYDLGNSSYKRIGQTQAVSDGDIVLSTISGSKLLTGKQDTSGSAIGNLGEKYSSVLGSISVYDSSANKTIPLNIGSPLIQYIGLLPSNYFSNSFAIGDLTGSSSKIENKQLQLETFALKPTLAPQREKQQSKPITKPGKCQKGPDCTNTCTDLAKQQCTSLGLKNDANGNVAWYKCYNKTFDALLVSGTCYDSPLYLYGKTGTKVDVRINTKITKPLPYSEGSYSIALGNNGQFSIGGKDYPSIGFSYVPAIKMPNIDYGRIVRSENVKEIIAEFGQKLGLNEREITDLKNSINGFSTPYVMVSFFDDETSKKILPISFGPVPDVYRNIVFYFRQLESPINVREPKFDNIPERKGFTAIEISHIIY